MFKQWKRCTLTLALLLLIIAVNALLLSCDAKPSSTNLFKALTNVPVFDSSNPSPAQSPSVTIYTAKPTEYTPGEKPFANLKPQYVLWAEIKIHLDSQPPDVPIPVKKITENTDIQRLIESFQTIEIVRHLEKNDTFYSHDMPVGANGFDISLFLPDGSQQVFHLYADMVFSANSLSYQIKKLNIGMDILYQDMKYTEFFYTDKGEALTKELFRIDGWKYFAELASSTQNSPANRLGRLIRMKDSKTEIVDEFICMKPLAAWSDDKRIVFIGYEGKTGHQLETQLLVSIKPDGSDRKILEPKFMDFETPTWDGGKLYYVGWTQDRKYPRPLNRTNADFTRHLKVMDIPGPLVTVLSGKVYCLSEDRKCLINMPSKQVIVSFNAPIEKIVGLNGWEFIDAAGNHYAWKP